MSGRFKGFFDVLTGFFLGAGTLKIYYETIDSEQHRKSFIFRQNKRKIDEIYTQHENLTFGKNDRIINRQTLDKFQEKEPEVSGAILKFGSPERSSEIFYYKNHVLCYDHAKKIPLWVVEHLTKEKVMTGTGEKPADRTRSHFRSDPRIPKIFQATNEDYFNSGWTRGHMAPAALLNKPTQQELQVKHMLRDNKADQESMNDTFLLSNILPQNYDNNANFWYRMEVFCRNLTKQFNNVYVISGPLWLPYQHNDKKFVKYEVIGENNVAVPTHLFKVILAVDDKDVPFIGAFHVPNEPVPNERKLSDFQVPLSKLEKDSGFHFFKTIDPFKAQDLCDTTGCNLMSKEVMENIITCRQLNDVETLEQLEKLWSKIGNKDKYIISMYQKKLKQLDEKQSNLNYIVDK